MGQVLLPEGAAQVTPPTGYVTLYAKSDGYLYAKKPDGTEYNVSGVTGPAGPAGPPGPGGTVTNTAGNLTASAIMVGNGGSDSKTLASLGTTTTVLHGNAVGLPTFGAVSLTADVSGVLPIANGGTNASSYTALQGNICPIIYYDGTKLSGNTLAQDIGYDPTTNTVYTSTLKISNALTTTATFTNTGVQGTTAGSGMIGYSDPGAAILSGNRLGFYLFGGSTDAAHTLVNSSGVAGYAAENWSGTNQGSSVQIHTTPNGSTTAARRVVATFGQDGTQVNIGSISGTQLISTIATGTAPLNVTSTTVVPNLNVSFLNGTSWAAPGAIGGTTPAAGTFTTLVGTTINGNTITTGTGTLTLGAGKTHTVNNSIALSGTDGTTMTFPSTSQTVAGLGVTQSWTKAQVGTPVALTVSANAVAVDLSLANNFTLTLQATTSQVLSNPTNASPGQSGSIYITQNATPSTLTFGTNWIEETTGVAPSVSTTASAQNSLHYEVFDSTHIYYVLNKHGVA